MITKEITIDLVGLTGGVKSEEVKTEGEEGKEDFQRNKEAKEPC